MKKSNRKNESNWGMLGLILGTAFIGYKLYGEEKKEVYTPTPYLPEDFLRLLNSQNYRILESEIFKLGSDIVTQAENYVNGYIENGLYKDFRWDNSNDRKSGYMDCNGFVSFVMQDLGLEPKGTFLGPVGFPYSHRYNKINAPTQNGDILVMTGFDSAGKYVGGHVGILALLNNIKSRDKFIERLTNSKLNRERFYNGPVTQITVPNSVVIEMGGVGQGYRPVSYFREDYYVYHKYNGATKSKLEFFRRKIGRDYFLEKYELLVSLNIINDLYNRASEYWSAFKYKYPQLTYENF
ncbi:MAG: hypothetical protein IPL26_28950 [Leptospiraceae bacterium]|nr:hypothetical protein [Leptospiraceae bacterium]